MSEQQLSDALNNCIDRLAEGETIDDCIQAYPHLEVELRSLLEIGQASSVNRASAMEVTQMRLRLDPEIENLIATTDFDSPSPFRLPQGVAVLVASLIVVVIGISLFLNGESGELTARQMTQTAEVTAETTSTIEPTNIVIPSATDTIVPTPEVTNTISSTITSSTTIDPTKTPDCPLPTGWTSYQVQIGDTLSLIAVRSGIDIETLRESNCLSESENLIVLGQILYVPRLWEDEDESEDNNSNSGSNANEDAGDNSTSQDNSGNSDDDDSDDDDFDDDDDSDDDD